MPTIHEESKQAMQRTRRRENREANKENTTTEAKQQKKKKRTIAEYQRQRQAIEKVTPTRLPHQYNPPPNYISQDEEDDQPAYAGLMKATQSPQIYSTTNPCNIKSAALYNLMGKHLESEYSNAYVPQKFNNSPIFSSEIALDHVANGVVHPVTKETITKYEKLANDPLLSDVWCKAMCKELGRLAQGYDGTKGTDTVFFMTKDEIKQIPKDRTVTYARIVVDYRPQKDDPNRVRITAGGNLIDYPGELTTRTADLTTSKILWNSTISTPGARYACADIGNMYLQTPMDRYEYMRIKADLVPEEFKQQYKLHDKIHNGYVYMEIRRGMYGLPQSGMLANKLLKKRLAEDGYFELPHTPGLFKHATRPVQFTLVVDDFGIKYSGKENLDHLLNSVRKHYEISVDEEGSLYCGITLKWNYEAGYVDISMPGYVQKQLTKYNHPAPSKPQHCPYEPSPIKYGSASQAVLPQDDSPPLDKDGIKYLQQVIGSFLYYCRATDTTIPHALSELASEQTHATQNTLKKCKQFLDYMATHPDATIRYYASDMILNVHSDASYLSAKDSKSRASGYFFLGSIPRDGKPIKLNGAIAILCTILRFVAASAAEAELGALFLNAKEARIMRLTLHELGHPQPPTPVHIDNSTTVGIVNNTVKRQKSRSMEMRYFWLLDRHVQKEFNFQYQPGQENLADYQSKAHLGSHHTSVRPFYLLTPESPRYLPRAVKPSVRRGCVDQRKSPYVRKAPLPTLTRVPRVDRHSSAAAA